MAKFEPFIITLCKVMIQCSNIFPLISTQERGNYMSQKVKQAIAATRAGKSKEAQVLLTQVLQENPDNTQAWYLLSLLVDSSSKKQAYLNKVVALDPNHEKAQQALASLQVVEEIETSGEETAVSPPPSLPIEEDAAPAIEVDAESLPDWLKETQPVQVAESAEQEILPEAEPSSDEEIPDWLKGTMEESWVESEQPTLVSEQKPELKAENDPIIEQEDTFTFDDGERVVDIGTDSEDDKLAVTASAQKAKDESSTSTWDRLLWALIAGAIIILLLMGYLIISGSIN
jgi:hypothetical protein